MRVPFTDLRAMHEEVRGDIERGWSAIIDQSAFIGGQPLADFERAFAEYCGTAYAVGVGSGTDAIRVALQAVGVARGDLVLTVPHTFIASAEGITQCGAGPVFVDVDPVSYTMDVRLAERFLSEACETRKGVLVEKTSGRRVSAILPVHLYGQAADVDPLLALARQYGIALVEDSAQAHGATYNGRLCGSLGDAAAFSFYPGKNLGAMGEAGAITSGDAGIVERSKVFREHGQRERYIHVTAEGSNARLDSVQAVVLNAKLPRMADWTERRRRAAGWYAERLEGANLVVPAEMAYGRHVWHLYVVQVEDRDRVRKVLDERGIGTGLHYPVPLHLQEAYRDMGFGPGAFPVSEQVASRGLSLPMFPHITREQVDYVAEALREAVGSSLAASGAR